MSMHCKRFILLISFALVSGVYDMGEASDVCVSEYVSYDTFPYYHSTWGDGKIRILPQEKKGLFYDSGGSFDAGTREGWQYLVFSTFGVAAPVTYSGLDDLDFIYGDWRFYATQSEKTFALFGDSHSAVEVIAYFRGDEVYRIFHKEGEGVLAVAVVRNDENPGLSQWFYYSRGCKIFSQEFWRSLNG